MSEEEVTASAPEQETQETEEPAAVPAGTVSGDYSAVTANQVLIMQQNDIIIQQNGTLIELVSFCFVILLAAFIGKIITKLVSVIDGA